MIEKLLKAMKLKKASDLFITVGVPPSIKVNGELQTLGETVLEQDLVEKLVLSVMTPEQQQEYKTKHELNFAIVNQGLGRFRVSAFYQRNSMGMVLRSIETQIPTTRELYLPDSLNELVMAKRGLIIMVGATGAGKSTSLAAMIGYRNKHGRGHIISIEDPIEYVHRHQNCIVTQREVGIDTESFSVALKNTLRQAPDVILIGEVRSRETMEHAITFAETGHLCLCTLHANNANQALDRIIHFFPSEMHDQLWMDLSLNLKAMVAQQLLPTADGKGRRAAVEIMINTPLAADLIRKGEVHALKDLMTRSRELGMQTFDQALYDLYNKGAITQETALAYADSANNVRLMIKLGADSQEQLMQRADALSMEVDPEEDEFKHF